MIGESLRLCGVQKRYGAAWAVQGASIDIAAGEFVSIVGPSGSGKTTLLSIVAGFEAPTDGAIYVGDAEVTHVAPNRRNIGMVFQRYALFPHMTVEENVAFPLRMRKLDRRTVVRDKVRAVLDLVKLSGFATRYPHQLSGGQQQRVALARALVFGPPVILMDEPLGALDKKLREAMQIEIKRMQERLGATVIYVTHDQEEALTMSDRIVVMRDGRVEQQGTPADLYDNPSTSFVASFIGTINFLPAEIESVQNGTVHLRVGGSSLILPRQNVRVPSLSNRLQCQLAVRPEHVEPAVGHRTDEGGTLSGTLESIIFLGAHRTALVRLDDAPATTVRMQMAHDHAQLPGRGSKIRIAVKTEASLLFSGREELGA